MLLVEVRGVSKRYGAVRALRSVSLRVDAGECVVLRGANGSGKTTLLGILGGVVRPSSGSVRYHGLGGSRDAARAHIGWVGHELHAYGELSVAENVEFFRALVGASHESARVLLARLDLQDLLSQPVRACSRGQRQRVSLARALMGAPGLLLLDEPTTGLDAATVDRVVRVLAEEGTRGAARVVITHDGEFARALGPSREVRLERGATVGA